MPAFYAPESLRKRKQVIGHWGTARTGQVAKEGTVTQIEHWDGSVDAIVAPRPLAIGLTGTVCGRADPKLVQEFERAVREHQMALASKDPRWIRRAAVRVNRAQERLAERG